VVTVLLGTSLKFEGKFIFQTRTDGPVDMLVADFTTPHSLRAYARFDADRVDAAIEAGMTAPEDLLGSGVLALTIDQGEHTQRYQGIVELNGITLEEAARAYFRQSEQIPTEVKLSVAKLVLPAEGGPREHWRAGGLLAQFLPDSPERRRVADIHGGDGDERDIAVHPDDNSWQELLALVGTIEPTELIDPTVGTERLLYRLFHEHGVRRLSTAFTAVEDRCSCSGQSASSGILAGLHRRGDRLSQRRGRRDPRQLRVLLEGLRVPAVGVFFGGGVRPTWPARGV
jgi:molecular chaperone Hsp33